MVFFKFSHFLSASSATIGARKKRNEINEKREHNRQNERKLSGVQAKNTWKNTTNFFQDKFKSNGIKQTLFSSALLQ